MRSVMLKIGFVLLSSIGGSLAAADAVVPAAQAAPKKAVVEAESPVQLVQRITDEMMTVIQTGEQALKTSPDKYFSDLEQVLDQAVHFRYISKFVMGQYWKGADKAQRKQFNQRFKRSMVETIGKGLANYADLQLTIQPSKDLGKKNVAIVNQKVVGAKTPVTISYWMAKSKKGQWKLIDVVLDGIKLRETFRSQFKADMGKYANDYNKTIENWNTTES